MDEWDERLSELLEQLDAGAATAEEVVAHLLTAI